MMVEWRFDCENCHHLTVISLHDTGPSFSVTGMTGAGNRDQSPCILLSRQATYHRTSLITSQTLTTGMPIFCYFPFFSVIFGLIRSPISFFSFWTFCLFLCSLSVRRHAHVDFQLFSQKSSGIPATTLTTSSEVNLVCYLQCLHL